MTRCARGHIKIFPINSFFIQKTWSDAFPTKVFAVLKIDPVTKAVVRKYATIAEAKTDIKCAVRTLKSAIAENARLRGFVWKYDE